MGRATLLLTPFYIFVYLYICIFAYSYASKFVHTTEKCPRDFRSWYGLGQAYEIMNMTTHAIFYYRKAQMLRLGEVD